MMVTFTYTAIKEGTLIMGRPFNSRSNEGGVASLLFWTTVKETSFHFDQYVCALDSNNSKQGLCGHGQNDPTAHATYPLKDG
jgi:hypothetical protein